MNSSVTGRNISAVRITCLDRATHGLLNLDAKGTRMSLFRFVSSRRAPDDPGQMAWYSFLNMDHAQGKRQTENKDCAGSAG
jgi:hypothetical protein